MQQHNTTSYKSAKHIPWEFCARSFCERRFRNKPEITHTVVNIYSFAAELRKWLMQEKCNIFLLSENDCFIDNPYGKHTSFLIHIFCHIVNDYSVFIEEQNVCCSDPIAVDLKRMRLDSEIILYATRLCESIFKQLLYCTTFNPKRYMNLSLGQLLACKCKDCKDEKSHQISFIGSLAHRYQLCGPFEECLMKDLEKINKIRNTSAAHATIGKLQLSSSREEAWQKATENLHMIGNMFVHMLEHISSVEDKMIKELSDRLFRENSTLHYDENLVSTYYWQNALIRAIGILKLRAGILESGK